MSSQLKTRLTNRHERRDVVQSQHEALLAERGDGNLSDTDKQQIARWRDEITEIDTEIVELTADVEAHARAEEESKKLRVSMRDGLGIGSDDGPVYETMSQYARDVILTRESRVCSQIKTQFGDKTALESAKARQELLLHRLPANTLSSNVAGLIPDQHIAQIFQVIQTARPIVASANRTTLERGTLTYPVVTQRPVVAVQASEKTEAGNTGMIIDMETTTASTYLGGGDLSWQAINWSTPDALDLWFRLAASDYALKTEQDAAQVILHSGFLFNISSTLGALTDFSDIVAAIAAGAGDVYANSGRIADTVYMAPNALYSIAAVVSAEAGNFINVGSLNLSAQGGTLAGMNVVVSRGMDSGTIVVGDSDGLLVAETAGAPVELRVVEPAIGGVEVGIIGAFEAVVVDEGAFALITTAS
jgi:HK97 family phage major capsid protein